MAALILPFLALAPVSGEPRLQERTPPLTISDVAGRAFDLDAMRGKVVLVAFWATWCAPCLAEFPIIEKFYREHQADGFEVIALSIDKTANRQKVQKLLSRLSFPGALASDAARNGFGKPEAVPVSYVIDAEGVIRDQFIEIDEALLNKVILPLLEKAMQPPSSEGRP